MTRPAERWRVSSRVRGALDVVTGAERAAPRDERPVDDDGGEVGSGPGRQRTSPGGAAAARCRDPA